VIAMLRTVLAHAVRLDLVPVNVARHPGVSAPAKSGRIWPRAAVAAMIRTADAMGHHSIGTAIAMAHWLGQRQGDVLTAPRSAWSGGRIQLTQSKTGARVTIPENPALAERLEAERARQAVRWPGLVPRYLILREGTDKPWPAEAFSHTFAEIRAALALEQSSFPLPDGSSAATASLWFMHLRHTAVTELATAGATALQISGITGHAPATVEQILSHYLVRTGDLADAAQAKRLAWQDRLG
jgi:hypothetical protein